MNDTLFSENQYKDVSYAIFLTTELGQIHQVIPWVKLAAQFYTSIPKSKVGRKPIFSTEGGLGLMFLKHYLGLSDKKLLERINSDWQLQYFCGIKLTKTHPIRDKDIVSRWRKYFGIHMNLEKLQDVFVDSWKPKMNQTHVLMEDATCYESYVKYPTDVKLLYNCTEYIFGTIKHLCKKLGISMPRTKYKDQAARQTTFSKRKRKSKRKVASRIRQLLYWTIRGLDLLQQILDKNPTIHKEIKICAPIYDKIKTIRVIYVQQYMHFNDPSKKIKNRIVSLFKTYLRPIIRGKENKRVEFGAKVHMSQVDGINLIEHLSFDAFHEGIRMQKSIAKHIKRFDKCSQYGGDQIYATNANRKFATKMEIATCFKRKGRASKTEAQKSQLRKEIGKARATRMEGSFGNEKNHYGLRKIKARSMETEIAWIFFGVHTANAVKMAKKKKTQNSKIDTQRQAA